MSNPPTPTIEERLDAIVTKIFNKGFDRQGFDLKDETAALALLITKAKQPLIESYELKVQDLAGETARASRQSELLDEVRQWLIDRYSCPATGSTKGDCCDYVNRIAQLKATTQNPSYSPAPGTDGYNCPHCGSTNPDHLCTGKA